MKHVSRLLLVAWFLAAQSVVWTDCGEGLFCPDKGGCTDDCAENDCCPDETSLCAHLEPQSDLDRSDVAPEADLEVAVASIEPVSPQPGATTPSARPDVPPRLRPRPLHLQLSLLLV